MNRRLVTAVVLLAALFPATGLAGIPAELTPLLERSLVQKHSGGDPVRGNYEDRTDRFVNVSDGRQIVITLVEALLLNPEQLRIRDLEANNFLEAQSLAADRYPLFGHWGTCFWEFPGGAPALDVPPVTWVGSEFPGLSLPVTLEPGESLVLNTVARNDVLGPVNPQPADVGELVIGWRFFGNVTPMTCGNGQIDVSEACDDGNFNNNDDCRNDCTIPLCGDEILDAHKGETCDPPGSAEAPNGNACRRTCTVCGDEQVNGTRQNPEDCDDGNSNETDGCRNDCTAPTCGDSILDFGETCDPPGQVSGGADNACRSDCTVCGDGLLNADEDCDDGNGNGEDACRNDCTIPECGDNRLDVGETCEPPGEPAGANGNACRTNCSVCGDGVRDAGESCDDANTDNDDTCRNNCTMPSCGDGIIDGELGETCERPGDVVGPAGQLCRDNCTLCGDGVVDFGEECDDGNARNVDGCRNDCRLPACGDGLISDAFGETCEPPGLPAGASGNNCRGDCTVCGDGFQDPTEGCDDGNGTDADGCRNDCTIPGCGNGNLDAGEECDDGNTIPDDGCRNDCTIPRCGDGIVDAENDETCDPPESPAGPNGNSCRDDCTVCGDGNLDTGEACDDGNTDDTDACRNDCTIPVCGDGRLDADETCDPPGVAAGGNGNNCRSDCTVCGDGNVDPDEDCDDGNGVDNDACRNDCSVPVCGDSTVDFGETCDPPGLPAGGNGNDCRDDCTVCGDANVDPGEACDDGNGNDTDDCRNDCTVPGCGDGTVDPSETCDPPGSAAGANGNACRVDCTVCGDGNVDPDTAEECDDGNTDDADTCRNDCTIPRCGDFILDAGETCDPPGDPAGGNGNNCRGDCTVCGDGIVNSGEICDDGNGVDNDGCRNDCTIPDCGDGILDSFLGETCERPGDVVGPADQICRDDCTYCGDTVVDPGEECDDGNSDDTDTCRNDCTLPVCGDSRLDTGETCDPPGAPAGINGNDCRSDCTVCGDGIVDPGESCDDGNADEGDTCRNDCTLTAICTNDDQCSDGMFCNGVETCNTGTGDCVVGTPVDCDDAVSCTFDSCNEATDACTNRPEDSLCDNGLFCDGLETCDAVTDCQAGTDPCAGGACDEAGDTCPPGPFAQMEWGLLASVDGNATTVMLAKTYLDPVVVASIFYRNNTIPVVTRVTNVMPDRFDVFLQNPSGSAIVGDAVNYIVVERGSWVMDGVAIEAQKYLSTTTANSANWSQFDMRSYAQTYTNPVVLGQVMSVNDTGFSSFWSRGPARSEPPSATVLNTGKMVGEDPDTTRLAETIGLIVIEGGHGTIGGVEMEAGVSTDTVEGLVNDAPFPHSFATPFAGAPGVAVAVQSGMDGFNGGWMVTTGASQTTPSVIRLAGDEDQLADTERSRATEQAAYWVFLSAGAFPSP